MKSKFKSIAIYAFVALTGVILAQLLNAFGITVRNTPIIFWGTAVAYCVTQPILFVKLIKRPLPDVAEETTSNPC